MSLKNEPVATLASKLVSTVDSTSACAHPRRPKIHTASPTGMPPSRSKPKLFTERVTLAVPGSSNVPLRWAVKAECTRVLP